MNFAELTILLPLAALCLWLTIFLFTLVDHFIYRQTYGHFLLGLDAIERKTGARPDGVAAMTLHMRGAKSRYLARYLSSAASPAGPARLAAAEYVHRIGETTLQLRAVRHGSTRRAPRLRALYALARISHPGAIALLEQALGDDEPVVAYAALDMLDIHDGLGAAEVLLRALDSGVLPASRVSTQLEHFRVDLAPLYLAWLESGHPNSRYWIAYLLGKSSYNERTEEALEHLLSDDGAEIRKMALSALSDLHVPRLQSHAERMLDDPVFFVRTLAARILAGYPNSAAVRALALRLSDEHDAVQLAAKRALVALGTVTLEHLPHAGGPLETPLGAAYAEITSTILHAQGPPGAAGAPVIHDETSHVR